MLTVDVYGYYYDGYGDYAGLKIGKFFKRAIVGGVRRFGKTIRHIGRAIKKVPVIGKPIGEVIRATGKLVERNARTIAIGAPLVIAGAYALTHTVAGKALLAEGSAVKASLSSKAAAMKASLFGTKAAKAAAGASLAKKAAIGAAKIAGTAAVGTVATSVVSKSIQEQRKPIQAGTNLLKDILTDVGRSTIRTVAQAGALYITNRIIGDKGSRKGFSSSIRPTFRPTFALPKRYSLPIRSEIPQINVSDNVRNNVKGIQASIMSSLKSIPLPILIGVPLGLMLILLLGQRKSSPAIMPYPIYPTYPKQA